MNVWHQILVNIAKMSGYNSSQQEAAKTWRRIHW
jgi:hypothetical protein